MFVQVCGHYHRAAMSVVIFKHPLNPGSTSGKGKRFLATSLINGNIIFNNRTTFESKELNNLTTIRMESKAIFYKLNKKRNRPIENKIKGGIPGIIQGTNFVDKKRDFISKVVAMIIW